MATWKNMNGIGGNQTMDCDGFYISYNPCPPSLGLGFGADDGEDETALCKGGKYYILNGDFRKKYEELAPQGFDACMSFFKSQNNVSTWSDKPPQDA